MAVTNFHGELDELTSSNRRVSSMLLASVFLFFVAGVTWTALAELDETVRGSGKVIPSSEIKRIQNFEGGIVSEILVKAGQEVKKGDTLIRLQEVQFSSRLREHQSMHLDLLATIARLEAHLEGRKDIRLPPELLAQRPELAENQMQLMLSRQLVDRSALDVLIQEREQISQELKEARSRLEYQGRNLTLLKKELAMIEPMVARGAASEMEELKLRRQINEVNGNIQETRIQIPKIQSSLQAAENRIEEETSRQRNELLKELNEARTQLESMKEKLPALADQVDRTVVRSPVDGIVKQVFVNTIGETISSGKDMVEIVPLEDSLLVEAQVLPKDIAFIHPGQNASVRLTAYDSSIYGSLDGVVEHISADAITDEQQKYSYYLVKIRTQETSLKDRAGKELPIIPGMVAEISILTGKKTVLEYILKPIIKTKQNALRER
ncbi:MAG: HlyD family type I secretion periplasmic adaptor subunit [Deltaproteobacteria bacterium HGW-Deltaproteobacteria-18]|nr:MAG: HlyD family type I secretion periplasmic adaptor subunit [Deltaproteobacteria bacterium HGW-Deltaproteobacteria-18]